MPKLAPKTLAAIAALSLTTAAANAQDLTIAVQAIPESVDPVTENSNVNLRIVYSLYETLVRTNYRDGGALEPGLATEWTVIDPRTIEFVLRDGVVFHNGDTLDAADVVATFAPVRRGADEAVPVASSQFLGGIDRVEVIDDMTVRIHMVEDDAIALNRFAAFPSHIISANAFNAAESYEDFAELAIGTGPYQLTDFVTGERVVIERFDGYWGDRQAAADTVSFSVVPELSTRLAGLFAGQFDIVTEIGADEFAQIDGNPVTEIAGSEIENIRGFWYDSTNSVLADARIRQAMNLAIDRQLLVDALYAGRTSVPPGWQMEIFGDMYLDDRGMPAFDPERARALLAEAGYDGAEINYRVLNYYTKEVETAQILQSMWRDVGLNVSLQVMESWSQVTEDDEDRHIVNASYTAYYPDPMGQFWRRFGPNGGRSGDYWEADPEMIRLGETLATSIDLDERRAAFAEMLDRFEEDPNGGILHTLAVFYGYRNDRLAFNPLPSEYMDLTTDGVSFVEE